MLISLVYHPSLTSAAPGPAPGPAPAPGGLVGLHRGEGQGGGVHGDPPPHPPHQAHALTHLTQSVEVTLSLSGVDCGQEAEQGWAWIMTMMRQLVHCY